MYWPKKMLCKSSAKHSITKLSNLPIKLNSKLKSSLWQIFDTIVLTIYWWFLWTIFSSLFKAILTQEAIGLNFEVALILFFKESLIFQNLSVSSFCQLSIMIKSVFDFQAGEKKIHNYYTITQCYHFLTHQPPSEKLSIENQNVVFCFFWLSKCGRNIRW